uniref:Uncharacterized protein n=1 Tax=Rhizophagus irregularis (strain DAOM 181602 / DAOM 197198 / MUCL 43194) TaxID=747089 RepID=U9TDF7_RHIID
MLIKARNNKHKVNEVFTLKQDIPKENSHLSNKIIDIQDDDKNDEISLKRKNPEDSSVTPTNNSSDNKLVDPTSKCKEKGTTSTTSVNSTNKQKVQRGLPKKRN